MFVHYFCNTIVYQYNFLYVAWQLGSCGLYAAVCIHVLTTAHPPPHTHYRDENARIGRYVWLTFIAIFCEDLLIVKMGWEIVTIPLTQTAVAFWISLALIVLSWLFWKFTLPLKNWPIVGPYCRRLSTAKSL